MARQKPDEVEEELQKDEDRFYGDQTVSGTSTHPDSDDDVEEMMSDVVGEDFDENEEVGLAEEIQEDEEDLRGKPIENYQAEGSTPDAEDLIVDSGLEKAEKANATFNDPMEDLDDDDFDEDDEEE